MALAIVRLPFTLAGPREEYRGALRADPCAYCPQRPAGTVDHIVPRASGGGNTAHDITGACDDCNQSKGTSSLLRYLLERLDAEPEATS